MQQVTEGVTQSGQRGLFTDGVLAWPFRSADDEARFRQDRVGYCDSLGFEYRPR